MSVYKQVAGFGRGIRLSCCCGSPQHEIRFWYAPDDLPEFDSAIAQHIDAPELYISVYLIPPKSFWRRLWDGLRYIFTRRPLGSEFADVELEPDDVPPLQTFLFQYSVAVKHFREWAKLRDN